MLAVRLCHLQSVKALLAAKCDANAMYDGWSVVQEAVCTGDAAILNAILEVRDLQRHIQRVTHVPQLLEKLIEAPDFYVEMKWEFTSWGLSCFCYYKLINLLFCYLHFQEILLLIALQSFSLFHVL